MWKFINENLVPSNSCSTLIHWHTCNLWRIVKFLWQTSYYSSCSLNFSLMNFHNLFFFSIKETWCICKLNLLYFIINLDKLPMISHKQRHSIHFNTDSCFNLVRFIRTSLITHVIWSSRTSWISVLIFKLIFKFLSTFIMHLKRSRLFKNSSRKKTK